MKRSNYAAVLKRAGIVIMLVCMFATSVAAQRASDGKVPLKEIAVKNLIAGISHENEGVRKDAIYYAGKFRVTQAVDALIQQLEKEENPSTRVLIILSLYMLGDERGLEAIYRTAYTDSNANVKRLCNAIYLEVEKDKGVVAILDKNK